MNNVDLKSLAANRTVRIVGIVIGVLILLLIAIPLFVNVNNFRPEIESSLSSALGRPVKVGNLSLSIFSGSVKADQLTIADDQQFALYSGQSASRRRRTDAPDFQQKAQCH